MRSLSKDYEKFEEKNAVLYPILVDDIDNARRMWKAYAKRQFPIYYDTDKHIANEILNQEWKLFKLGRMPALIVVDKNGIIQYAYYGDNMHDIPENDEVLNVLDNINS
ncbi:MAG: redoxin domain-containing protein [Candidatus Lokiarchaeota archaeon]|nr:redoxin domain-containing protein [Candidatus Lokiarchaeota archaeon]